MAVTLRDLDAVLADVDLVALDAEAVLASVEVAAGAGADDLGRPTPCAGWTVGDLLAHMTAQHYGFAAASTGDGDPANWIAHPPGERAVDAYRSSARHVLRAFAAEGVMERRFPLPEVSPRPFTARQAIGFHLLDYVVHSWDVAKASDVTVDFGPELLGVALTVAEAVPRGEARLAPGAAFAPEVSWSGGSPLDRIVAVLGRSPGWPSLGG